MNVLERGVATRLRGSLYTILICLAVGNILGRILAVEQVEDAGREDYRIRKEVDVRRQALRKQGLAGDQLDEALLREEEHIRERIQLRRPFLSANDRSRWCTVRALVEPDMRVPGFPYAIDKVIEQPRWDTIDMVKCGGHFYSSKPPLYPTLLAGQYWLIYHLTGLSLAEQPFAVVRTMLVLNNVLPLVLLFVVLRGLVERFGRTDFGRIFVMGAGTMATFLTTFAVTLNNHLPAAVAVALALYAWVRIAFDGDFRTRWFVLAGLAGAFAVADELPALSFLVVLGSGLFGIHRRLTLAYFLPAAVAVGIAFFATNSIAVHSLRPAYMHRSQYDPADNWYDYQYVRHGQTVQSYWKDPVGVDRGEPSHVVYALHALVGHHGIFSLTPIWLLSVAGVLMWLRPSEDTRLRHLAAAVALLSLVCLGFYLTRPLGDRNYGGKTSGLRWMFWFAPLWLTTMIPAADALAERATGRALALVLLVCSTISVSYPIWNPWSHPWLYDFATYLGWIN